MSPKASSSKNQSKTKKSSRVESGVAGAGGGTLLVLLANNLPDKSAWKSWAVLIAPSVSVGIGVLYELSKNYMQRLLNKRALAATILRVRATLTAALQNPNTSEQHRAELRKELEQLELLTVKLDLQRIKTLTTDTG